MDEMPPFNQDLDVINRLLWETNRAFKAYALGLVSAFGQLEGSVVPSTILELAAKCVNVADARVLFGMLRDLRKGKEGS